MIVFPMEHRRDHCKVLMLQIHVNIRVRRPSTVKSFILSLFFILIAFLCVIEMFCFEFFIL